MMNRFNRWLLLLVILVAVPFWWLLIDNSRSDGPAKPVHMADLRKLAALIPGKRPVAVTEALLASRLTVGDYEAAGIGIKRRPLAIITWVLPVPGKGPIIINPGLPRAELGVAHFPVVDTAKLNRINAETRSASLILHTQGDLPLPGPPDLAARVQYLLGGKTGMVSLVPTIAVMTSLQPRSFTTAQAIAPGVVVLPTTGYAPDKRLIFVQLADGREFLFAGNIATLTENWSQLKVQSHLADIWAGAPDRGETYAWLRTIRQLRTEAPQLKIVPGHDYLWLAKHLGDSTISEWQPGPIPPPPAKSRRSKPH